MSRGHLFAPGAVAKRSLALFTTALLLATLLFQYGVVANPSSVRAASTSASLDQCANGAPGSARVPCTGAQWQNGNLNESNSQYREGDSVPFRALVTVAASGPHKIWLQFDNTKSSVHAYDYLTSWDATESGNPTSGAGTLLSGMSTTAIITPGNVFCPSGFSTPPSVVAGQFTLYGGTLTGMSYTAVDGTSGIPGTCSGDQSVTVEVDFTTSSGGDLVLAWGGHIGSELNWGAGHSAVAITGSPYHQRLLEVDTTGIGNEDRSLKASAVLVPPTIATQVSSSTILAGQSVTDSVTVSGPVGTAAGSVVFWLCNDGATATGCPTGGTQVGSAKTLSGGTATSDATVSSLAAGNYCFRAEYTPASGSQYVAGTHTNSTTECFLVAAPALHLDKAASPLTYTAAGQSISYTYTLTNSGNVTLSAPYAVSDDKATVACPSTPATLAPGATVSCSASYTIAQADLDAGSVTNHATATAMFGKATVTSNQAEATVTAVQSPHLSITKASDQTGYSKVGDVLHYTVVATNDGNVTLHNVVVTDAAVTDLSCTPSSPVASLAPGATIDCTASHTVTQADLDAGHFLNTACVAATGLDATCAGKDIPGTQAPALHLDKAASPLTYTAAGQSISYTYTLTNSGNVTLSAPYAVSDDKATVACPSTPATLAPGATVSCSASYTIAQADLDAGSVTNHATATAMFGKATVTSNQAEATVTAVQTNGLALVKKASPVTYDHVGQTIAYTYTLTNQGNVTLYAPYAVIDDKITEANSVSCPSTPATLAPSASLDCTASYTITQADLDVGLVTNIATATAKDDQGGTVTSNHASATVTALQSPALHLDKAASPLTYTAAGQSISYTYTLTNSGNVTLSAPYAVSDDKATVACPSTPATLAPGATVSCSASYTIAQADLDAGSVTNHATATAMFGKATVTSNQAEATVTLTHQPAIIVVKTPSTTVTAPGGGSVTYTYSVLNAGNVPLSNVTVTDDKCSPVSYVSGDTNSNQLLDLTETWKFTCTSNLTATTTNVATATGHDGETTVSATDSATVMVPAAEVTPSPTPSPTPTPKLTLPPTSTVDGTASGTPSGTGLLLVLALVGAVMLTVGLIAPRPAAARRRARNR